MRCRGAKTPSRLDAARIPASMAHKPRQAKTPGSPSPYSGTRHGPTQPLGSAQRTHGWDRARCHRVASRPPRPRPKLSRNATHSPALASRDDGGCAHKEEGDVKRRATPWPQSTPECNHRHDGAHALSAASAPRSCARDPPARPPEHRPTLLSCTSEASAAIDSTSSAPTKEPFSPQASPRTSLRRARSSNVDSSR